MTRTVLVVTSTFPRWRGDAVTPFIEQLCTGLVHEGWRVGVLAPHDAGALSAESWDGIDVHRFRYAWPASAQTLFYRGGALVTLNRSRGSWLALPGFLLAEFWSLLRLARRLRPAIIHAHWLLPQGLVAVLVGRLLRIPTVVTLHGADVFSLRGAVFRPFKRMALRLATVVTANSTATARAIASLSRRPIERIPIGAHVQPVSTAAATTQRERVEPTGQGYLLVFVGRLIEEKGPLDLVEAMPQVLAHIPQAKCVLVGDGPLRTQITARARTLGVEDRVQLVGWLPPADVAALLAAADVLVGPSRTASHGWIEAQGIVFAEALLAKVPVVATRSGGIPDTIIHEVTGLLVPEADPTAIAAAVVRLHDEPELATRLRQHGYAHATAHLTMTRTVKRFADLYASILVSRSPVSPP